MIILISPAKTIDMTPLYLDFFSLPIFSKEIKTIARELKKLSFDEVSAIMKLSDKMTTLTLERIKFFNENNFTFNNSKQAILAFKGEVYRGLKAEEFSYDDFEFAQNSLRILSGLYGLLRPMDLIQSYRLEMGTKIKINNHSNLYKFWGDKITTEINKSFNNSDEVLINLASKEYFRAITKSKLKNRILTINFKEFKGENYKTIAVYAKKARGLMTNFIIRNKLTNIEDIKQFAEERYFYNEDLSSQDEWIFTR